MDKFIKFHIAPIFLKLIYFFQCSLKQFILSNSLNQKHLMTDFFGLNHSLVILLKLKFKIHTLNFLNHSLNK